MALERFFKDLSNGHEFFIDQGFGLATISKTSCPEFSVATVMIIVLLCFLAMKLLFPEKWLQCGYGFRRCGGGFW